MPATRSKLLQSGSGLAAVFVALVGLRAAASGQTRPKLPSSSQQAVEALHAKLAARGRATAAAVVGGKATRVGCGATLTVNTTLNADLNCVSSGTDGLDLGASGIALNLNGHFIIGERNFTGINNRSHNSDTVENCYVDGFSAGVGVGGSSNIVTKLHVSRAMFPGLVVAGATNQVTSTTLAENGTDGLLNVGSVAC